VRFLGDLAAGDLILEPVAASDWLRIAELVSAQTEPSALVETALGPLASADTRQSIARAESRQQAITLALMAPEFQRR